MGENGGFHNAPGPLMYIYTYIYIYMVILLYLHICGKYFYWSCLYLRKAGKWYKGKGIQNIAPVGHRAIVGQALVG